MVSSNILIVDDDPLHLELLQGILKPLNARIFCASSGEEALSLLSREHFDVIISDLVMPGISGLDLLMFVQRNGYNIPVIIITAYSDMESVEECIKFGAFDYISKPYDHHLLRATVRRALIKKGLAREWFISRENIIPKYRFPNIIGNSDKMGEVYSKVIRVAESNANVCIYGESGTGKELIARAIHYNSPRKDRPLVTLDCTAIPEGLMESEMFGHVKGAFTSLTEREGVFQLADKGTLFLDEIGELSLSLQAKLLRVIQCREFRKVGGSKPIKVDVRIIAATNKELRKTVLEGKFREDLFYRINVIPITIPPLRERKEDIPLLVDFFIEKFNRANKKKIKGVSPHTMGLLQNYNWPGNVRELENYIERAVVMAEGDFIDIQDFPLFLKNSGNDPKGGRVDYSLSLRQLEKEHILRVLREVRGNKTKASELLGISLRGFQYKLKTFSTERGDKVGVPR